MYDITEKQLQYLSQIYNTLGLIFTKGEDSEKLVECRKALRQAIEQIQTQEQQEDIKE